MLYDGTREHETFRFVVGCSTAIAIAFIICVTIYNSCSLTLAAKAEREAKETEKAKEGR